MMKLTLLPLTAIAFLSVAGTSQAAAPDLKTPGPVIYLADNLDEADNLGWCIDTVGRGFSDKLHTHSCKPNGGDVQFMHSTDTLQISSATYDNKCATMLDAVPKAGTKLGLLDCQTNAANQQFNYNTAEGTFHPKSNADLCLSVGNGSRSAGPFMSRDLSLTACDSTDTKFKQWKMLMKPVEQLSAAKALGEFAWKKRQIVVFTPSADDPRMRNFNTIQRNFADDFAERFLQVWVAEADKRVTLAGKPRSDVSAESFYQRFQVKPNEFRIVLIGYDQGEKLRQSELNIDYLLGTIDQMPMRQQEMRSQ